MNWKFWQKNSDSLLGPDPTAAMSPGDGFDAPPPSKRLLIGLYVLVGYLLAVIAFGIWWSVEPATFSVSDNAKQFAGERQEKMVNGYTTTSTFIRVADSLMSKPGGYISNDLFPPGLWMDNMPEWEFGVLTLLRDTARVYRNDFARSQSQSAENENLAEAEAKFFFNNNSWLLPRSEDEYRDGIRFFEAYLSQLSDESQGNAQFYSRADNLQQWLAAVETRLGSLSQRLSSSIGKRQLNTALAGDSAAAQSTGTPQEQIVKTPWLEIDNIFYEARGFTWALIHLLQAVEQDFGDVLDKKAARVSLQQIVRELELTQDTLWSPMVLNGDGFGIVANHSLIMASHISRANAAIIDLRTLLTQG